MEDDSGPADPQSAPPLASGQQLAPGYYVLTPLHRSSVLDVYDVWSEERACRCVAKALRPDRRASQINRRRLVGEGRLLKRLTHPHIVRAYEVIEHPEPVVVLETLPGATLAHLIELRGRLRAADVAFLGLHLCSAVHYLHRRRILHLDLKPSNIVVHGGLAKVIDLSIAQRPGPGRRGVGTRAYMAPEQARGRRLSEATDVWAIGAVLFEAAIGRPAFAALEGSRYDQLERPADRVRAHRRLPGALSAAIDACLDPDAARRPAVDDLLRSFARIV